MIIGQKKLLNTLDTFIQTSFPRFIILSGERGSGRRLVAEEVTKKLDATLVECETKVDAVREVIALAYKVSRPTLYLIPNADKMSLAAKNALLKVTEEPPKRAYFIITVSDLNNILTTLKSRATVLKMDEYTFMDKEEWVKENIPHYSEEEINILLAICNNFSEMDLLCNYGVSEFYDFCCLTAEHIGSNNPANAMKIALKLKLKDDAEGYDPCLFMRTIIYIFSQWVKEEPSIDYVEAIKSTSKYLTELNITGVSKAATLDMWILEMVEVLNG